MIEYLLTTTEKKRLNLWVTRLALTDIEQDEALSSYLIELRYLLQPKGIFQLLKHLAYYPITDLKLICQKLSISSSTARRYLYALKNYLHTYTIQLHTKGAIYLIGDELLIRSLLLPYFILDSIEENIIVTPSVLFSQIKLFQMIRIRSNRSLLDRKTPIRRIDSYLFVSEQGFSYMWEQLLGIREITTLANELPQKHSFTGNYALGVQNKLLVFFHQLNILANCYFFDQKAQQFYSLLIKRYEYTSYVLPFNLKDPLALFALTCFFEPIYPNLLSLDTFIKKQKTS